ncbi:MAG: integrase core domain-containing protein [bacterium]
MAAFELFLDEELIDHSLRRAHRPQGGGKIEAVMATVQRELWDICHFESLAEAEQALAVFFADYNHRRAHLGIGSLVPADRFFGRWPEVAAEMDAVSRRRQGAVSAEHADVRGVASEQRLWESFAFSEHETAGLVEQVVAEAAAGREGLQLVTDQGKPFLAQAARDAYDALGLEHAPQREGAPTEKATVERAFGIVKSALAPLLALTNRLADAVPSLRRPELAQHLGSLLFAVFLRVYGAGRKHLGHPLEGHDPDALRAIIDEQRDRARAEHRSVRLFLEAIHAEYAMPGSRETFVRTFRRYPLEDLHEAERRFRAYACRCVARVCDRYFAAVVRDVHEAARRRRSAERAVHCRASDARHARAEAAARAADLDAHPERRLHEGLDLLADTWQSVDRCFAAGGVVARVWLRRAVVAFRQLDPATATDEIERHFRSWVAAHLQIPLSQRDAVRRVLLEVITDVRGPNCDDPDPASFIGAILRPSARASPENQRPSRPPHLRI